MAEREVRDLDLAFGNALRATEVSNPDGRHSDIRRAVEAGIRWLLPRPRYSLSSEVRLPSGQFADLVVRCADGELWIVEIKSSKQDFRTDKKWKGYRRYCDRLFFATTPNMQTKIFPNNTGLIVANLFEASLVRDAPLLRLAPSTRNAMISCFRAANFQAETRAKI